MIDKDKVQAQRLRDKMIYSEVLIIQLSFDNSFIFDAQTQNTLPRLFY